MKLVQTKPALHIRNRVTEDWPYTYRDRVDQHAQTYYAQHAQTHIGHGRLATHMTLGQIRLAYIK